MKLITDEQHTQLIANALAAREAAHAGRETDPIPVVKLITPGECTRWLLAEIDPSGSDRAYGLLDRGDGRPILGYVHLRELESKTRIHESPDGIRRAGGSMQSSDSPPAPGTHGFVPKETDLLLRTHLAQTGMRKGAISKFVADAVRWQLFHLNLEAAQAHNLDVPSEQIEDEIEQALAEVRKERFAKRA